MAARPRDRTRTAFRPRPVGSGGPGALRACGTARPRPAHSLPCAAQARTLERARLAAFPFARFPAQDGAPAARSRTRPFPAGKSPNHALAADGAAPSAGRCSCGSSPGRPAAEADPLGVDPAGASREAPAPACGRVVPGRLPRDRPFPGARTSGRHAGCLGTPCLRHFVPRNRTRRPRCAKRAAAASGSKRPTAAAARGLPAQGAHRGPGPGAFGVPPRPPLSRSLPKTSPP